jgi:hypothetical protein
MSDTGNDTDERRKYDTEGRYRRGELLQEWINDTLERAFGLQHEDATARRPTIDNKQRFNSNEDTQKEVFPRCRSETEVGYKWVI